MKWMALLAVVPVTGFGSDYQVESSTSLLSVVTHKAGIASVFAHNHMVVARNFVAQLDYDEKTQSGNFKAAVAARDLEIDDAALQERWYPTFESLGILSVPFSKASVSDRQKMRNEMLAEGQLNEKKFPEILATAHSLERAKTTVGRVAFDHVVDLTVVLVGKPVKKKIPAKIVFSGNTIEAQAFGAYKFSEFGIEPFSGMLGAVKNQDDFHLFVNLKAEKK